MPVIPVVSIMGNKMKRLDLGKISTFKGKLHQMLEMGKNYIISSSTHKNCEANSSSKHFDYCKFNGIYLAQMEITKAEGTAIFERQRKRFIN
ncbi:MAG: hypothetical protein K6T73_00340 [Candidatus Bathyarchaeota archaeon]|nr:hypothetical protein [Candidatus Bathyarchaeota archaeon]